MKNNCFEISNKIRDIRFKPGIPQYYHSVYKVGIILNNTHHNINIKIEDNIMFQINFHIGIYFEEFSIADKIINNIKNQINNEK